MTDIVQANYETLDQVSARFAQQGDALQQMLQNIRTHMEALEGEWIGKGHDAFFREMGDSVVPACDRLCRAFQQAAGSTKQMANALRNAEQEASGAFQVTG